MRVMHINSYSNGSTGHIARSVHEALLDQGEESVFAYGSGPKVEKNGYRIGNRFDWYVHTVTTLLTGLHGYSSVLSTYRLVRKIKKFRPDIVHLHSLHGSYLNLWILFKYLKKSGVEVVLTPHDCWPFTGKCYHYYEAKCDRYLQDCGNCPQLSMYPKSYFFDFTKKMLRDKKKWIGQLEHLHIVTISDWLRNEVGKTFLGNFPCSVIRNGVGETYNRCDPAAAALPDKVQGRFVILGVASSWNVHKGIFDFIALSDMLAEDEVIVLVGHVADNVVLPDNVVVVDHTQDQQELAQIYNSAGVYVSMSTEESFGLTIAEALACGTPSIVYDATACTEMVSDGENGFVVPPHDLTQVYEHIRTVKHGGLFDKTTISSKARQAYSAQRMKEEYLAFYRGILDENYEQKHD